MKINPLLVIAGVFAASFAGRAIGIANATLNRPEVEKSHDAPKSDIAPPAQLVAAGHEKMAEEQHSVPKTADGAHVSQDEHGAQDTQGSQPIHDTANSHSSTMPTSLPRPVSASHQAAQYSELMSAIRDRTATLDNKSMQIEDRIRVLEILETRIEIKLTDLKKSNEELSELVNFANDASQEDISMLAKMYEQMKPARAGEIFNKMSSTFAAGFLTEMNTENAALVLTNMSTDKAYEASMIIASRNAAVHQ